MAAAIASAIPATAQAAAHPAWRIAYTLPGGTATVLDGIAAASQNHAWAFGVTYTVGGEINELTGWGDHRWAAGLSRHWSDHLVPANPSAP